MFCTGDAPTVPGIRARFSNPGSPCASVQATKSCQFWPAAASMIQALGPAASTRSPMISILSTTGLTSPVRTMVLPPPSTKFGIGGYGLQISHRAHAHQGVGARGDAKGVPRLQRDVVLDYHWPDCRIGPS